MRSRLINICIYGGTSPGSGLVLRTNIMKNITALILAAGKGTRTKVRTPKVLLEAQGQPIMFYLLDELKKLKKGIKKIVVVTGYGTKEVKEAVSEVYRGVQFCTQKKLDGTAGAVKVALKRLKTEYVLIVCGDAPLVQQKTLSSFVNFFFRKRCDVAVMTSTLCGENDFGKLMKDEKGKVCKIVEKIDRARKQGPTGVGGEANSGIYLFKKSVLRKGLGRIRRNTRKKEFFLTDIIEILYKSGYTALSYCVDHKEVMAVNTLRDLSHVANVLNERLLQKLSAQGVYVVDPQTTFVSFDTRIGRGSVIYPFTFIEKDVIIGGHCKVGPFAHIRAHSVIEDCAEVGNFAEIVRSRLGKRVKAKHFSYLGDVSVDRDTNIGAGTVVANYDGKSKHKTHIEAGAFIGSDTVIVAPVRIGKGARTGAGSVVTRNVKKGTTVVGVPARLQRARRKR